MKLRGIFKFVVREGLFQKLSSELRPESKKEHGKMEKNYSRQREKLV